MHLLRVSDDAHGRSDDGGKAALLDGTCAEEVWRMSTCSELSDDAYDTSDDHGKVALHDITCVGEVDG